MKLKPMASDDVSLRFCYTLKLTVKETHFILEEPQEISLLAYRTMSVPYPFV